jgi:hypothetical protein
MGWLKQKQTELKQKALTLRNIRSLIETDAFEELFDSASKEEQDHALDLIDALRIDALRSWARRQRGMERVVDLRNQAKAAHIIGYSRMSREELERAIADHRALRGSSSSSSQVSVPADSSVQAFSLGEGDRQTTQGDI